MTARLPAVIVGGYLGAGKTTLVNHLLRQAGGRRIAVLVNDFGEVSIDADLIGNAAAGASAGVLSLAGGCLCCSFGSDLLGTVTSLLQGDAPPDALLIELSGVALPAAVRRTLSLLPAVETRATWVLVDAAEVQRQATDRYVGDTVRQQLLDADWVLINKPDLVDAPTLQALQAWLQAQAPAAQFIAGPASEVAGDLVWDSATLERSPAVGGASPRPARAVFASRSLALPDGLDLTRLGHALAAPDSGVLRAKALARDAAGQGQSLQVSGGRWLVEPASVKGASRLVMIGLRGVIDAPDFAVAGLDLKST